MTMPQSADITRDLDTLVGTLLQLAIKARDLADATRIFLERRMMTMTNDDICRALDHEVTELFKDSVVLSALAESYRSFDAVVLADNLFRAATRLNDLAARIHYEED